MADNQYKSAVPTQEVKLSNGEKLVIYKYLTIGESRDLQRIFLKGGNFDVNKQEFLAMSGEVFLEVQDTALSFLAKEVIRGEEKFDFSQEWFNALSIEDGTKVIDAITDITNAAQAVGTDEKKA